MPNAFGVLSPNLTQNKEKMKNFFLSFFHVSDDSEQLSKNFQKKNLKIFLSFFRYNWKKMKKKFSSFFHVSDDSEQLSKNFQKNFWKFF